MVTDISLAQRLFGGLRRDIGGLWGALTPSAPPGPGLYTYRVELPGGRRRIHLRIEGDGAGVLFVDVTDAIHLNPTAAEMAKMALEDVPIEQARGRLLGRYRGAPGARVDEELAAIYAMVDGFRRPESGCPTCAVSFLQRAPLFSTRARAPYKVDLALTYGCNNECPHCYNEPGRLGMASLSKTDWFRVLDRLAEIGVPHIIFTGGEATLHPDLPDLIRYADGLGQVTGLNTNGRRLAHRPYMRTLAEAGLDHVQITLGSSYPEVHDAMMGAASFHQTVRGIHSAFDSGVHAITNTTLMRCNMDHVEHIVDFLFALGIRTFAMNGMIYSGGGFADPNAIPEHELAPLLVRVRDHAAALGMRFLWYTPTEYCRMSPVELEIGAKRCNAGEYSMCVEPNGDVLPCQSYYVSAGNILRDAWERIWQGDLFRSFREREEDPRWAGLPEKCWECPDLPLCGGGCRIEREAREGRRVAEGAGGCSGCGGGSMRRESLSATAGFIPSAGLINTVVRASGKMAVPVIGLSDIAVRPDFRSLGDFGSLKGEV
ncbi:MAG TPA: radical SAM protein [Anaerolineae bacterium]|nr:radical SAM protein [Anaerolineae bacterium]